ncbi:MAG: PspC domain protein, partial [Ilumatobacteraceae bacterium]|nr:PspC domain protein [Ilumatobacteraceae bacterium]
ALTGLTMGIGNGADWWQVRVLTGALTVVAILIAGTLLGIIVNRSWFGAPMLVVFSVVLGALLIAHPNLDGGFGDRTVQLGTVADAAHVERLGAGRLTIDLTQLPSGEQPVSIDAAVGFGQLRIIVPAGDELQLTSHIGAGQVRLDGVQIIEGVRHDDERTLPPRAGATTGKGRTVTLDLEIGGGEITIDRAG